MQKSLFYRGPLVLAVILLTVVSCQEDEDLQLSVDEGVSPPPRSH